MLAESTQLRGKLGPSDRAILDEYLGNIRQVEQQLDRMESRLNTITGTPEAPLGLPEAFDDHMSVTYDLMHLAFQGDISRVFTFMIGHEASDRGYAHIGIPETHHSISHHGNDAEKLAKYAKIGTYQIVKLGEFLDKLKATKDGDGNLLDHSMVYWGSGMSNGNQHDRNNPPAVIVGGAHGRLKGNRHVAGEAGRAHRQPAAGDVPDRRRGDRQVRRQHGQAGPVVLQTALLTNPVAGNCHRVFSCTAAGRGPAGRRLRWPPADSVSPASSAHRKSLVPPALPLPARVVADSMLLLPGGSNCPS